MTSLLLENITPLILTYNEAPNICRSLEKLKWAPDIVVVDSFSNDPTLDICRRFPQVRAFQRNFDGHANQWNFGLCETGIKTEWVLALDADYVLSDDIVDELGRIDPRDDVSGYRAAFRYCVWGKPLHGTLYPSVTTLYRKRRAHYVQEGHTQRLVVQGKILPFEGKIFHDDRKPLTSWLQAQDKYQRLNAAHLKQKHWKELRTPDRLRKMIVITPLVIFLYCLFVKGSILDGRAGLYYALQRMLAEALLSLRILDGGTLDGSDE